jgi:hypothetical protein
MLHHKPNTWKASPQCVFSDGLAVYFLLKFSHRTHTCLNIFPLMSCVSSVQQNLYTLSRHIWKEERFVMNPYSTYLWVLYTTNDLVHCIFIFFRTASPPSQQKTFGYKYPASIYAVKALPENPIFTAKGYSNGFISKALQWQQRG